MKTNRIFLAGVFFVLTVLIAVSALAESVVAETLPYEVAALAEENRFLAEAYLKDSEGLPELLWDCVESLTVVESADYANPFYAALLDHMTDDGRKKFRRSKRLKVVRLDAENEKMFLTFNDYRGKISWYREFAANLILKNIVLRSLATAGVFYSEGEYALWRERLVEERKKIMSVIILSERIRKEAISFLGVKAPETDPPVKTRKAEN